MQYVAVACRVVLAVVFVVAAVGKLSGRAAYRDFVSSLRQMRVVPSRWAGPLAGIAVAVEVAVVVLLAVPRDVAAAAGFVLAAGLLAVFAGAIGLSLRRGNTQPCRCFGRSATPLGRHHVIRNVFLIAIAVLGAVAAGSGGAVLLGPALVAALAGLIVGGLVAALDDLLYLFRPTTVQPR
ncbi:formate/nitrite transporter FocA (FNT family) [Allocatelliglobosispora scoriae]|uniref:Formate/nitrite transporter FocA (FNT family) n=1 Tax=Allocatelliglobosispora scoriae TaxID=643052 RepID=A0A841C513_9ACTN|nr:MauE/DoxX family redox-associated membrane protein [Allocatelliglobosispora scoriae]MBB5874162.1 formate/nitrite transporter FocA (FNT family) [Allocatelliglobosispora scoriae]